MPADQAPCTATGRVDFPASVTSCLRDQRDESAALLGGILSDTRLTWLSKGPLLEIVHSTDGAKIAAWTFGAVVRDFKTKVTCVADLPHLTPSGFRGTVDQVVVGLECELTGGMVCIFNLAGSRVVRAINIPSKVTALNVVALGSESLGPLHQCFKSMSGVAAVGTNDGQILLIDLRRNDCDSALHSSHNSESEGFRDELQSCGLISVHDADSNMFSINYPDDHLFLRLNEKYLVKHQRLVIPISSKDQNPFLPEDPSITSLLFVPQLGSLIAGFAFGSFQIWSLQSLSLVYTLPVTSLNPLVRLSFQEACDDPNAYCYLWAVRGGLGSNESVGDLDHPVPVYGPPSATMFSLCYDEKVWLPEYGHFYKNFMMCSTGFELDLSGGNETVGGRLVSLYAVNRGMPGPGAVHLPSEDSSALGPSSNAISLCLIVWETWGPTGPSSSVNPVNTHMAFFDINQWYVDQMPSRLSLRSKSIASYLVSYDLGSVISASGGLLLDVRVDPNTLIQFSSVQNSEEFSKPASLSFGSEVLMERQVVHVKHPGLQRALLSNLMSAGPGVLMTPTNLFHECLVLGLRPLLMDISNAINVPVDEQRTFVLCVALEQRLGRFVSRCAREWADGRLSAAGCTLKWLLSVVWNRAAVLKQLAIRICAQLFDHSGDKLESNDQRQLRHIVGIFHLLETLFENVVQNQWHLALNDWPQVNLQNDALKLECQYYDVLQWLIDVELLPEGLNPAVPYPAQEISDFYQSRRIELKRLLQQQGEEEEELELLLIDGLLNNELGGSNVFAEWGRDAGGCAGLGTGRYPPISLQALLRTFLVKDVALSVKQSVVIYVLMDLANILDNEQYQSTLKRFMNFPAAFCMSAGTMRLTQAFWHLDHKAFDTALDMLLDPLVSVRDIAAWQHRCIIKLLTLQGQANMALRYVRARRPPLQEESDIRLHMKLLIANDLIDEAFMYQRSHRAEGNMKVLLNRFFQGCEERNNLRTVLKFSLDDEEEMAFSRYLESSKHPSADDLRVLYLLKRSRYVEALDVNQALKKKGRSGGTRDVVVSGFYKTLPSVTRKLATHCAQQQNKLRSWSQVERPTPLFVNPKITSPHMRYKSSLHEAAVERSRETWTKLLDRIPPVTSEIESTPFLCTPRTKLINCLRPAITENSVLKGTERKRSREDDGIDQMEGNSLKRSRFQKLETALAVLHQQSQQEQQKVLKERRSTYTCTDTLTVLHTPVVQRRSPSSRAKLQQQMIACSPGHSTVTPQSIIKVRSNSSSLSKSESPKRVHIKDSFNEPELTEEESESEPFSSSTKANKGESETDSELGDKDDEEGLVGVTARRIIDFDSDVSSDLSASQSSVECHTPPTAPSPSKPSIISSERSLSRIVVLSEARKAGKPHTVTFGKGSICVYDQDEPVDAELAVQEESSNDTVDQEPSRDELPEDDQEIRESEGDESTQECDFESSILVDSEQPVQTKETNPNYRSLRLHTSGIGSMSTSAIQDDLSVTEDSEVFLSADSIRDTSNQGTMCSPNFRKSLARPPVREITRRISGSKRTQQDLQDDDYEDETEAHDREDEVCKSARLIGGSANASSSQHSQVTKEQDIEPEETQCETVTSVCNKPANMPSFGGSFRRPSIRKPHLSVGVTHDTSSNASSTVSELFSAQSVSFDTSNNSCINQESPDGVKDKEKDLEIIAMEEINSIEEVPEKIIPIEIERAEKEIVPSVVEEVDDQMDFESSNIHSHESHASVDIVELDDSDAPDIEASEVEQVVIEAECVEEEKSEIVFEAEEDSEDRVIISDNSNIFRTSHIDNVDSSSESQDSSVQNATEDEHLSSESDSQVSKSQLHAIDFEEISEDKSEPQTSTDGSDLNRACVESEDISEDASVSGLSKDDVPVNQSAIIGVEDVSASISVLPVSNEEENVNVGDAVEMDVDKYASDQVVETAYSPDLLIQQAKAVPCDTTVEVDQDDMPALRFDAATSSPEDAPQIATPVVEITQRSLIENTEEVMLTSSVSGSTVIEAQEETKPSPSREPSTPVRSTEPSTPRSRRKGSARRSSVSSVVSETHEEDASSRRVTRSQQRSLIMEQSFETVASDVSAGSEIFQPASAVQRRTRKTSATSPESKPTRTRRSSVSSTGSAQESQEKKTRRRGASVSSLSSAVEAPADGKGKLEGIAEEESVSSVGATKAQRRRKVSEVSDAPAPPAEESVIESYEDSRRLTRHQRALLAKSMEMNVSAMHRSVQPRLFHDVDDEGLQSSDEDDRMSVCSVRSSQRLRAKRQRDSALDSPSSTASTVINPALTPTNARRRQRRQSNSDLSELNRDASPASSVRRHRSMQGPGTPSSVLSTPTRRSARLSARQGSSQQSEDGDNQSLASLSPSSVTSGRKSATRRPGRRLSLSSEMSVQYDFASPQVEHPHLPDSSDADLTEAFVFSPPKTIATPSKARSNSTDSGGSASKKSTRQSKAMLLQTIKEESSTSRVSVEDSQVESTAGRKSDKRQSWFFIPPPSEEDQTQTKTKKSSKKTVSENRRVRYSAFSERKVFVVPMPQRYESDEESVDSEESETEVKSSRTTRKTTTSQKQKK